MSAKEPTCLDDLRLRAMRAITFGIRFDRVPVSPIGGTTKSDHHNVNHGLGPASLSA